MGRKQLADLILFLPPSVGIGQFGKLGDTEQLANSNLTGFMASAG